MKLKLDLHIHSEYSYDSNSKINSIIKKAEKIGLDGIAITDHEEFFGAEIAAKKSNNLIIIKGQEIDTEYGDIIGLFLKHKIETQKFAAVISEIKRQKGIVVLPHPAKFHILVDEVLKEIDVVEVFNARLGYEENNMAKRLAEKTKKRIIAGSDAHFLFEIGNGITIVDSKSRKIEDIKDAILSGKIKIIQKRSRKCFQFLTKFVKIWRRKK